MQMSLLGQYFGSFWTRISKRKRLCSLLSIDNRISNYLFYRSARKIRKRFLNKVSEKDKENGHTSSDIAVKDEEHQQEEHINKDIYNQLLEKPFLESLAAAVAKSKLQFRWKSREEMGKSDDYSTITA